MNQNLSFAGLGTFTTILPIAGPYFFEGKLSLPTLTTAGVQSACVVTVNQNGSAKYTGTAGAEGFKVDLLCAANDTVTIVLSSAAAIDQLPNMVKATIAIGQGV